VGKNVEATYAFATLGNSELVVAAFGLANADGADVAGNFGIPAAFAEIRDSSACASRLTTGLPEHLGRVWVLPRREKTSVGRRTESKPLRPWGR
jgi:hypothetical protein